MNLQRRASLAGLLALSVVMLASGGCTVGPDYVRPALTDDVPTSFAAATAPIDTTALDARWWEALGDPILNQLVGQALAHNHDLQRATAAVIEARAAVGGARSERLPTDTVSGTASRSLSNSPFAPPGTSPTQLRNGFDAAVSVKYELDLWGRLSRAEESARASLLASEASRRVVRQTLVADVARTWLQVRELQCRLGLDLRTLDSYRSTLATVEQRYLSGVASALDLRLARQNVLAAEAAVPGTRRQLRDSVRRLEILAGRYPAATVVASDEAAVLAATMPAPLPPVPVGLPSSLLERRPDLVAAEAGLHATVANVGSAKARLYPTLSLTGSAGYNSTELDPWFDGDHDVWSLVGNLVSPLFNRGATKAQVKAAEARARQSLAAYEQAVLTAFGEVESALDAERFESEREATLGRSVAEARLSLELAQRRYASGLDPLLTTLETQRRLFAAESQLLAAQRAHRTARVNLILALGGPWDLDLDTATLADVGHPGGTTP
ncbi:MAG: efflux transporter outer membrane subunit [Candidatus Krumholzibacteriia bacterium]